MLSRESLAEGRATVCLYATAVVCVQCALHDSVSALMCSVLVLEALPGLQDSSFLLRVVLACLP